MPSGGRFTPQRRGCFTPQAMTFLKNVEFLKYNYIPYK